MIAARLAGLALAVSAIAGCTGVLDARAPWETTIEHDVGRPVLSFKWKQTVIDHSTSFRPQEFARVSLGGKVDDADGSLYVGSHGGELYAFRAFDGALRWHRPLGATSGEPVVGGKLLFVGTDAGTLYALDTATGAVKWTYAARGAIQRPPVVHGDMLIFATDADRVIALDRDTGKWRWQYDRETPEEFTLRGHAGVSIEGEHVFAGFADGHVVALAASGGEIVWVRSLAGDAKAFVDVDTTPLVAKGVVYAASSQGGLYALDAGDGTEKWHIAVPGTTQLALDDGRLYAAAAESGLYAIDLGGHVLWRQGFRDSGDPASPQIDGRYLFLTISERGLYVIDKLDGSLLQSFNPGPGVSSAPTLSDGHIFFMSNGGVLYSMLVEHY